MRLLGEFRQRSETVFHSCVLPQAHERCWPPAFRDLFVEQGFHSAVHHLRSVPIWDEETLAYFRSVNLLARSVDEDLQILPNERILLGR